ncbi:WxL domain-containing protein [Vagococcus sp. JNUCC 83]
MLEGEKKEMKKIIASSAVCLIALGTGLSVSASGISMDGQKGETDVRIGFENDSDTKPTENGKIQLSRIPTAFDFGQSNRVIDQPQIIKSHNANPTAPQYLAVNDLRDAQTGKWEVNATASEIVNMDQEKSATDKLTGANISFTSNAMSFTNPDVTKPTAAGTPFAGKGLTVSSVSKLAAGQTQQVLNTTDASTLGSKEVGAQITDVSLYVPANVGTPNALYTGTVTWTLDDVTQG